MSAVALHPTRCPICQTEGNAAQLYPANFDPRAFNPAVFSARRLPDRLHYRLVRCATCELVRSDPVAEAGALARLYAQSSFDYGEEVRHIRRTYGRYLARLKGPRGALLEVGCGNGFLLEEALDQGWDQVWGVEPSQAAVAQAAPRVQGRIRCDVLRPGLFAPASFDAICMFQVFDHLPDPGSLLPECLGLLRPGGRLLLLNHNVAAWSARLLGERSPIVDIEHTCLYSPATLGRLVARRGFRVEGAGAVLNDYSLHYLARLLPLPGGIKGCLLALLQGSALGRFCLRVPLGNLWLVARRPEEG
ncbi:MAG: class I SAM-dependent methyltransferase [Candidatus Handelsmanbacteria bacterium]|nr:class I SAM-dependent methyltransferase [Candidatus Handelsmanbacteria bacterium]